MPPIVSIVGESKSGKTTLIEKLVPELKSRGYRVATVKHAVHGLTFDETGKDSWRQAQAGSDAVAISSPDKLVLIRPTAGSLALDQIARLLGEDCDIVLAEGFKQGSTPKIEVHRKEVGALLGSVDKLMAIVTDEPLETKKRQFSFQDIKGLADLLEKGFLKPQRERISLYVNNTPISLSVFPKKIITRVVLAMASCLKGVGEIRSLEIFLRKGPERDEVR
jgi:molybdopterin-guanine dinucleotide biosynthesis protein B